jgi:hypothetical protein
MEEMSREDFEKIGQRLGEEEVMQRVIALETDEDRARHIRLNALTPPPSP